MEITWFAHHHSCHLASSSNNATTMVGSNRRWREREIALANISLFSSKGNNAGWKGDEVNFVPQPQPQRPQSGTFHPPLVQIKQKQKRTESENAATSIAVIKWGFALIWHQHHVKGDYRGGGEGGALFLSATISAGPNIQQGKEGIHIMYEHTSTDH